MRFANIGLALVLLTAGCKARDADILAQVVRKTGQKVGALTGDTPGRLADSVRGSAGDVSLAYRVYNRIHWDRYLTVLDIQVETTDAGTVTLRGKVPDLAIKQRIIDLARSTTGVQHVEEQLTLPAEE